MTYSNAFYKHARSNINISGFLEDGMHVKSNNCTVEGLNIKDPHDPVLYDRAHRDGIQIIPYKYKEPYFHYAGGFSKNIIIKNNFIYSENKLQCIFAGDGGHTNLQIIRNNLQTQGSHFITIAGLFSGTIQDNRMNNLELAPVKLLPMRIGGNPDGLFNVWIIHFRQFPHSYLPLKSIFHNKPYNHVVDNRTGNAFRNPNDIYLHSFKYSAFRQSVTQVPLNPESIRDLALEFGKRDD